MTPLQVLLRHIAKFTGETEHETDMAVRGFCTLVRSALLEHGSVYLPGIGRISVEQTKGRHFRLPRTGRLYWRPGQPKLVFTPKASLRRDVVRAYMVAQDEQSA